MEPFMDGIGGLTNSPMIQSRPKFIRRDDLTPSLRMQIASTAVVAHTLGVWGVITNLSQRFKISRTFVYMLAYTLLQSTEKLFCASTIQPTVNEYILPYCYVLSLRLEGRCSIEAISSIMKRFDLDKSSVGSISQSLTYFGSLLPDTLSTDNNQVKVVVFLCDEIFSKEIPILVTVDPISSAILKIELSDSRKSEDWKRHWRCLEKNGYYAAYLVCDEGKGLCSGKEEALPDIFRQSDTYHAIAHQLGQWANRLEIAAYAAIQMEYDCLKKFNSARSDGVIEKRIAELEKAEKFAVEKIELYENFSYVYKSLVNDLRLFDKNGKLRDRLYSEENIKAGLDLLESLAESKISEVVKKVRRTLPELLNYFDVAVEVVGKFKTMDIDQEALRALCLAWQWNKGAIKAKQIERSKYCTANEQFCLEFTEGLLQESYNDIKEQVYKALDNIVQSSALVECINSIIRPYLDSSKNQISQETLKLIMFYHNHRRYNAGKRKGKTPMEILTGKKQDKDWIELLLDVVNQANPSFFSLSQ
jgi:hypothetical protein